MADQDIVERRALSKRVAGYAQWALPAAAALATLALGFVGFSRYQVAIGEAWSVWDRLYLTAQLFIMESGSVTGSVSWELQVARWLAPALAGYTAVKALAVIFRDRFEKLRIRLWRGHVVICGLGRKGSLLARSLRRRGVRVVVVEKDADNDLIAPARDDGTRILIGEARERRMLAKARVDRARHLVAVCSDDGTNAEIAVRARELLRGRRGRRNPALSCWVHVVDPQLCTLLRMQELGRAKEPALRLDFFNVYETGARRLLAEHPPWGRAAPEDLAGGHLLVVGLGRLGESLVLQAAEIWKSAFEDRGRLLRVTVVDRRAEELVESLRLRHPRLVGTCDLRPVVLDTASPGFLEAAFLFDAQGRCRVNAAYVCLDDDATGLSAALALHGRLRGYAVPVVVRMTHDAGLASLLREDAGRSDDYSALHAFGLLNRTCNPEVLFQGVHERLARTIHEDYRRQRLAEGKTPQTDPAVAPWEELAESYRESNRDQAAHIGVKLAVAGCDLAPLDESSAPPFEFGKAEVELLARMEHERWVEERRRSGWRRDDVRDEENTTSPYLVAWDDLDKEIQKIDKRFVRELPRLLATAGFRIVRVRRTRQRPAGLRLAPEKLTSEGG